MDITSHTANNHPVFYLCSGNLRASLTLRNGELHRCLEWFREQVVLNLTVPRAKRPVWRLNPELLGVFRLSAPRNWSNQSLRTYQCVCVCLCVCALEPVYASLSVWTLRPPCLHMCKDTCNGVFVCVFFFFWEPSDSHYVVGGTGRQSTNSQPRVACCLRRHQTDLLFHVKGAVVVAACAASGQPLQCSNMKHIRGEIWTKR